MSSQTSYGNFLFQTIDNDLNASLAVADELSKEFSSLMQEASSSDQNKPSDSKTSSSVSRDRHLSSGPSSLPSSIYSSSGTNGSSSSKPLSPSSTYYTSDSVVSSSRNAPSPPVLSSSRNAPSPPVLSSSRNAPSPPVLSNSPHSSPKMHRVVHNTHRRTGSDSYVFTPQSPKQAPRSPRPDSPSYFERSPQGLISHRERSRTAGSLDPSPRPAPHQMSPTLLTQYDSNQMSRRSPQPDRGSSAGLLRPSPLSLNSQVSSTLPRNFSAVSQTEESAKRQKSPSKWNETDLDVSYDRKPHHTYDKTEWLRSSAPNSNWRESNLDNPAPAISPKKDPRSVPHQGSYSSLPRGARIAVPPDALSTGQSPFGPPPIVSRVNMPPVSSLPRQSRRIPISVILRLQNPHYGQMSPLQNQPMEGQGDFAPYRMAEAAQRKFIQPPAFQPQPYPPELRQPAVYSDALHAEDVDAEIQRLDIHHPPPVLETPAVPRAGGEVEQVVTPAPRPLSPTRLQPVVAPEVQNPEIPDREELLRIRAEIPRALKRRGSVDVSQSSKKASQYQPNQYKTIIHKLFHRKDHRNKGEKGSDSSSDGEEPATPPDPPPTARTPPVIPQDEKYNSILRKPGRKKSGRRAKLSPLVLLLDAALMGEMDTVMRAVKEMSDPSQANDEGITGLHNAICGGHHEVTDFLVRIGANVSAPDSHGWTPLHCAASCNDREMCEYLVRNGAAVMAFTHRDGATASQKCDPYLFGFEECESYLRAKEESMGVDNNGVLYALWSYQAQAPDELSFKEGDMVTILQKTDGSDWWWASLCGREGFVPNNLFGLFPKVRPKSLC
ncbi:relA-associated inhibitor isoform X2 [Poecilia reticulata]|nr:PREDICTED: relA-associated inhibitor isoform X2 [Poecilia reticulata]XP_008424737.1 PREDICTED: relA-associated inhibitor isoform X2 [Poecilia reticulata]XP_008424738.1 PREDICTED: relA-associated inhibitor isoform X2 [Poecilia reticulata]XP_017163647.1 PREDICTED: relA-associated inhibitor isoform X2 [Poecilia reticulata]